MPELFPGATWVGSKMPGKPWAGTTQPIVVLHTLEFNGFPSPTKWDAPSHLVYDPRTREIRQYLSMDKAAYSVRDNALEDDEPTYQVELFGSAANVPNYDDIWYSGLAELVKTFSVEYDIPIVFADFTNVQYGQYAPQRMTDKAVRAFSGFLGHCHMGRGQDSHWDPGKLDVTRVLQFAGGVHDPPPLEGDEEMRTTLRYRDGYNSQNPQLRPLVVQEQAALTYHGFPDPNTTDGVCGTDGMRGPGTTGASKKFQGSRGLVTDGVCGPDTWAELDKEG